MKRLVAVVFILIALVFTFTAFAEEEPFYPGVFHVGMDFKPGSYNIRLAKGRGEPRVYITIYESEEAFSNGKSLTSHHFETEGYHLSVLDGMVFEIEMLHGDGSLSIVNETPSWMIPND